MNALPNHRRGFLRGLASLPLIGGSVALVGKPTAAAVAVTPDLLDDYKAWLDAELRFLAWEMADMPEVLARYGIAAEPDKVKRSDRIRRLFVFGDAPAFPHDFPPPSSRAAVVLAAVGAETG